MADVTEEALARWFAQGMTSREHPVLDFALRTYLGPLGVACEALEMEPFGSLESGAGDWWLREPRWDAGSFDRGHPAAKDFGYLLEAPGNFRISVSSRGWLAIAAAAPGDLAAEAFLKESDGGWLAARHSLQAAREAEAFVYAAAGLILADESTAAVYASGQYVGFCQIVRRKIQ